MKANRVEANRDSFFFGPIYLSVFFAITVAKCTSPAIENERELCLGNVCRDVASFGTVFLAQITRLYDLAATQLGGQMLNSRHFVIAL
jgi:hypothetical protein